MTRVRWVLAALSCAGTVACTAILGLDDKPLVEIADAAPAPRAILFGGYNQGIGPGDYYYLNDTWSFDGETWKKQKPHSSPSPRSGASTTALGGRELLFGGTQDDLTDKADLWSFSDGTWTRLDDGSVAAPPPRTYAGVAALGTNLVLFGGFQGAATSATGVDVAFNDTWVWNGASWARETPTTAPPIRDSMMMATLNGKVVLFGGENTPEASVARGDTWEWNGRNWTELHPAHSPPARVNGGMALVQSNAGGVLLLFGGFDGGGDPFDDTWTWDGTDWTELHPEAKPAARGGGAMSSFKDGAILFGGLSEEGNDLSDTWLFSGSKWTHRSASGPGARVSASVVGL